jgi:hypothetical protein
MALTGISTTIFIDHNLTGGEAQRIDTSRIAVYLMTSSPLSLWSHSFAWIPDRSVRE